MQHITRLLMQARKAAKGSCMEFVTGFVDYDPEKQKYTADPHEADGIAMPKWWKYEWETQQEAADALNRLYEGQGIPEESRLIFIMDLGY